MSQPLGSAPTLTLSQDKVRTAGLLFTKLADLASQMRQTSRFNRRKRRSLAGLYEETRRSAKDVTGRELASGFPRPLDQQGQVLAQHGVEPNAPRQVGRPVYMEQLGTYAVQGWVQNARGEQMQFGGEATSFEDAQILQWWFAQNATGPELLKWQPPKQPVASDAQVREDLESARADYGTARARQALIPEIDNLDLNERSDRACFDQLRERATSRELSEALRVKQSQYDIAQQQGQVGAQVAQQPPTAQPVFPAQPTTPPTQQPVAPVQQVSPPAPSPQQPQQAPVQPQTPAADPGPSIQPPQAASPQPQPSPSVEPSVQTFIEGLRRHPPTWFDVGNPDHRSWVEYMLDTFNAEGAQRREAQAEFPRYREYLDSAASRSGPPVWKEEQREPTAEEMLDWYNPDHAEVLVIDGDEVPLDDLDELQIMNAINQNQLDRDDPRTCATVARMHGDVSPDVQGQMDAYFPHLADAMTLREAAESDRWKAEAQLDEAFLKGDLTGEVEGNSHQFYEPDPKAAEAAARRKQAGEQQGGTPQQAGKAAPGRAAPTRAPGAPVPQR